MRFPVKSHQPLSPRASLFPPPKVARAPRFWPRPAEHVTGPAQEPAPHRSALGKDALARQSRPAGPPPSGGPSEFVTKEAALPCAAPVFMSGDS